ncbi:hypothetical protein N9V97_07545 [Luminiphilus sp.]|nr:hypothetical protein [Luminiphilus sp.]
MTTRLFLIGTALLTFVFSNVAKSDSEFKSEEDYLNQLNSGDLIQTRLANPLSNEQDRKLSRSLELTRDHHREIRTYLESGDTFFDQFKTREEIKKWTSIFNEIKELEKEGIRFYLKDIGIAGATHLISESAQGHDVIGSCVFGLPGVRTETLKRPACLGYVKVGDKIERYHITFAHWSDFELKSKTKDSSVFPTDLVVFKGKLKQIVRRTPIYKSDWERSIIYVDNSNDQMGRINDYLVHRQGDTEDLRKYKIEIYTYTDSQGNEREASPHDWMARPIKK